MSKERAFMTYVININIQIYRYKDFADRAHMSADILLLHQKTFDNGSLFQYFVHKRKYVLHKKFRFYCMYMYIECV